MISLVVTTINDGSVLDSYCSEAEFEGLKEKLKIIVIPDRKSPCELFRKCDNLKKNGFDIYIPAIQTQKYFLDKVGFPQELIPYDSDNRRNIGYLMALDFGSDVIISIDDDNYCSENFRNFSDHMIVAKDEEISAQTYYASDGWINFMDWIYIIPEADVYPRGFPYYKKRYPKHKHYSKKTEKGKVRLNAGLWSDSPDLDAMTWLISPVRAFETEIESFLLGEGMWAPINTQNTSLHRSVMPSYYYIRSGAEIDRFGDIFSGYFCQKCMQHMGDRIRVGTPMTIHKRNEHNYMNDFMKEFKGILISEDLIKWLQEIKLEGTTYAEAYLCLSELLDSQISEFYKSIWTLEIKKYFYEIIFSMQKWAEVCAKIG